MPKTNLLIQTEGVLYVILKTLGSLTYRKRYTESLSIIPLFLVCRTGQCEDNTGNTRHRACLMIPPGPVRLLSGSS